MSVDELQAEGTDSAGSVALARVALSMMLWVQSHQPKSNTTPSS